MSFHSVSRTLISAAVAAVISTGAMADTVVDKGFTFSLGGAYNALMIVYGNWITAGHRKLVLVIALMIG